MTGIRNVRLAPALLVLLLSVRVATAAAVACQHELADAARAAERAQAALQIEALALGGELCVVDEAGASAHDPDRPHLTSPCPFFKSPIALPAITTNALPREANVSHLWQGLTDQCPEMAAAFAPYKPRGPPAMAGEVLARAPRFCPVVTA